MKALFALALLIAAPSAHAAVATTTVPAQSTAEAPSTEPAATQRFSLGVGTGISTFGGNAGKLYSSSSPLVDVRGQWAFSPMFAVRAGGEFAKYAFNAAPNGAVDMNTQAISAAAEWHFLSTALSGIGFDPYALGGAAQVFRTQSFKDYNSVEKDNAMAVNAGIGANYLLHGGNLGFWAEADAGQVFFRDRYDGEYLASGIEDLTGPVYSARLGVKYVF